MRSLANIHSRERSANMCTRSAFKIYMYPFCFALSLRCPLFTLSSGANAILHLLQRLRFYFQFFHAFSPLWHTSWISQLQAPFHESGIPIHYYLFCFSIPSSSSLSLPNTHTHTLLLTLAFECTVAECAHANNIHSFRERVFFFVSFTESFLSVWFFLLWACNQVPCAAVWAWQQKCC